MAVVQSSAATSSEPRGTTPTTPGAVGAPVDVSPSVLEGWLAQGDTVLVDVREDHERAGEHIPGSAHAPLSRFDAAGVQQRHAGKRVVFHCRSGKRSSDAAGRFGAAQGGVQVFHLAGGIEGWKASGRAVEKAAGAPRIDVMRQVQITAGSIVLIGVGLGAFVHPAFLGVSAFIGAGLVFAGASGWCGMAMLLGKMPWNRTKVARGGCGSCACH
ncbi:MAG: rhodanese-like domain-containing protein [Phycisphaerales bacterium]|nr:rhodanese-like domain-containing protein [Phycisphaerales bacterium]